MSGNHFPWRANTDVSYTQGPLTASLTWRYISSGVLYTSFFDNASGPLSVDNNNVPSISYFDLGASYRMKISNANVELFARAQNLLDKDPPVTPSSNLFDSQFNAYLYDGIGRYFRLGVRVAF